jgi:RNA polymerase sigma factor (sigma-70 family)
MCVETLPVTGSAGADPFSLHCDLIERALRVVIRRHRLPLDEAEEFAATVRLRLIEDDYAILRKFRGDSRMITFLVVVTERLFQDSLTARWGRWRPSAEARRLGPVALRLEMLLGRDRLALDEAIAILRTNDGAPATARELEDLAARLPIRQQRRLIGEEHLAAVAVDAHAANASVLQEGADRVLHVLRHALRRLSNEDRLFIRLRFVDQLRIVDIARRCGFNQKALYRRFRAVFARLFRDLQQAGVTAEDVREWIGRSEVDVSQAWYTQARYASSIPRARATPSVSPASIIRCRSEKR